MRTERALPPTLRRGGPPVRARAYVLTTSPSTALRSRLLLHRNLPDMNTNCCLLRPTLGASCLLGPAQAGPLHSSCPMVTEGSWDPMGHTLRPSLAPRAQSSPGLCGPLLASSLLPPSVSQGVSACLTKPPQHPNTSGPTPSSLSPSLPHQSLFPGASLCTQLPLSKETLGPFHRWGKQRLSEGLDLVQGPTLHRVGPRLPLCHPLPGGHH